MKKNKRPSGRSKYAQKRREKVSRVGWVSGEDKMRPVWESNGHGHNQDRPRSRRPFKVFRENHNPSKPPNFFWAYYSEEGKMVPL